MSESPRVRDLRLARSRLTLAIAVLTEGEGVGQSKYGQEAADNEVAGLVAAARGGW